MTRGGKAWGRPFPSQASPGAESKMDRMSLPKAKGVAQDAVLEMQAEMVVDELLDELYIVDTKRGQHRWGRDVALDAVPALKERIINRVVYGR